MMMFIHCPLNITITITITIITIINLKLELIGELEGLDAVVFVCTLLTTHSCYHSYSVSVLFYCDCALCAFSVSL